MPRKLWIGSAMMLVTAIATPAFADEAATTPSAPEVVSTAEASGPPVVPRRREAVYLDPETRAHRGLLITGAALLVGTYAVTASLAGASRRAGDRDLFVPGVGPFINLSNRNCSLGCVTTTTDVVLIMTSGVLQNIGAGLMILSTVVRQKVPEPTLTAGPLKMHVVPTGVAGGGGLGAFGTF